MSRTNNVNPDHYKVAGRLAPDDLARERMKQGMAKAARDWDERRTKSLASMGPAEPSDEAEAAVKGSRRQPARTSRAEKGRAKTPMKKSAAGTKKKALSKRSAATKPARRTAARKKTSGSKRRRVSATR